ncbi:MAG: 50S ribosomal protein L24 [Gammaproteobacteria bacterium]|nr:MAG: 50S ribosomal protein L24 [Gammaproteobacteria bacterium]
MKRIKKGDEVVIIAGKDKGNIGTVEKVDGERVIITGQNLKTKHIKPNPMTGETGGRVQKEASIHVSNVQLVEDGKPVKVGFRVENGKKVRYSKASDKVI